MLDIFVPQPSLQGAGVVTGIGQGKDAAMSQHVRMRLDFLAAAIKRSISAVVRYSRVRTEETPSGLIIPVAPLYKQLLVLRLRGRIHDLVHNLRDATVFFRCSVFEGLRRLAVEGVT